MKPSKIAEALTLLVKRQRPVFLWGGPGIGKSDIVSQLVTALNSGAKKSTDKWELKDLRLSLCDPTDLKGFPMPNATTKKMAFFPPEFLPTKGRGILFLDEMNSAPQAVQAAAYQLVLNRKLGDYVLPEGWSIVAAGNRAQDRSVVHAMPAALANRFVHLDVDVDVEDWVDWAIKNGISDATRGYIRFQPGDLTTSKIDVGVRAFPTPRTWAFADQIINGVESPEVELELLKGTLGEGVATKFVGYLRERKSLPNIDMILIEPDKVKVPESPSTCYAVIAALESRVQPTNFGRLMKYVKRMSKEFEVVFATSAVRRDSDIAETKEFTEWIRENRSVLI